MISSINIRSDTIVITYSNLSKLRSAVKEELTKTGYQYSYVVEDSNIKSFMNLNVNGLVAAYHLHERGFTIEDDFLLSKVEEIKHIFENKESYIPSLSRINGGWQLSNADASLTDYLESLIERKASDASILMRMKLAGVKFTERRGNALTSEVLHTGNNHFLINEDSWSLDNLLETINEIDAFPLLVVIQEGGSNMIETFEKIVNSFKDRVDPSDMVSLVMPHKPFNPIHKKVNELSVGNKLVDSSKVVFIGSSFLASSFKKSFWNPFAVLYLCSHNFGTVGSLVKNYPVVFYYNTLIRSLF